VRILIIEDDKDVASFIRNGLTQAGCNVDHAANGKDGLFLATTERYDALVVDRMLPGVDGLTVIRTLRASSNTTPVLILSALGEVDDRVKGLKAGGDDYLVKPFDFGELLARIRALQRRPRGVDTPILSLARLALDPARRAVTVGGREVVLTPTEFAVLEVLLRREPAVVDRKSIAEHAWADETDPIGTNAIDVQVSRLRAKLVGSGVRIIAVRGAGYRLQVS